MNGDWGLGIGDWAQSPIPNPQSPKINYYFVNIIYLYLLYKINLINLLKLTNKH